jgi:hypothetical protein
MDPNALAGMAFTLLLALLAGGFILLFPLSRRLGLLLEARVKDRNAAPAASDEELLLLRESVAQLATDLQRVTDRQEFMEKLLSQRMDPRPLGTGEPPRR